MTAKVSSSLGKSSANTLNVVEKHERHGSNLLVKASCIDIQIKQGWPYHCIQINIVTAIVSVKILISLQQRYTVKAGNVIRIRNSIEEGHVNCIHSG